eukprot:scaffold122178_cov32-Tisochrysis_lutea.AAC.1
MAGEGVSTPSATPSIGKMRPGLQGVPPFLASACVDGPAACNVAYSVAMSKLAEQLWRSDTTRGSRRQDGRERDPAQCIVRAAFWSPSMLSIVKAKLVAAMVQQSQDVSWLHSRRGARKDTFASPDWSSPVTKTLAAWAVSRYADAGNTTCPRITWSPTSANSAPPTGVSNV